MLIFFYFVFYSFSVERPQILSPLLDAPSVITSSKGEEKGVQSEKKKTKKKKKKKGTSPQKGYQPVFREKVEASVMKSEDEVRNIPSVEGVITPDTTEIPSSKKPESKWTSLSSFVEYLANMEADEDSPSASIPSKTIPSLQTISESQQVLENRRDEAKKVLIQTLRRAGYEVKERSEFASDIEWLASLPPMVPREQTRVLNTELPLTQGMNAEEIQEKTPDCFDLEWDSQNPKDNISESMSQEIPTPVLDPDRVQAVEPLRLKRIPEVTHFPDTRGGPGYFTIKSRFAKDLERVKVEPVEGMIPLDNKSRDLMLEYLTDKSLMQQWLSGETDMIPEITAAKILQLNTKVDMAVQAPLGALIEPDQTRTRSSRRSRVDPENKIQERPAEITTQMKELISGDIEKARNEALFKDLDPNEARQEIEQNQVEMVTGASEQEHIFKLMGNNRLVKSTSEQEHIFKLMGNNGLVKSKMVMDGLIRHRHQ